jgi:hypothetical protein
MKRKVESWSVERLHAERTRLSFPEYQRQPNLWSSAKKSLLIDSILQDIDIPKLYFNYTGSGNYEVIDGQQRLWAIWGFLDEDYPYASNGTSHKFSALNASQRQTIIKYELQVTTFDDAKDAYLRELFVRLQLGLLLNVGERLHAASGEMKELVFDKLTKHQFTAHLGTPDRRFAKETLCAQICINSFTRAKVRQFARTRYEDLLAFFNEYERPQGKDRQFFQRQAKTISAVLDQLWACFGDNTKRLRNRSYALSVYLFFEELIAGASSLPPKEQKRFTDFIFKLWKRLREEIGAGFDRKNRELYVFETLVSSAPGEKYQIERRHQKLEEYYEHFKKTGGKIKGD